MSLNQKIIKQLVADSLEFNHISIEDIDVLIDILSSDYGAVIRAEGKPIFLKSYGMTMGTQKIVYNDEQYDDYIKVTEESHVSKIVNGSEYSDINTIMFDLDIGNFLTGDYNNNGFELLKEIFNDIEKYLKYFEKSELEFTKFKPDTSKQDLYLGESDTRSEQDLYLDVLRNIGILRGFLKDDA